MTEDHEQSKIDIAVLKALMDRLENAVKKLESRDSDYEQRCAVRHSAIDIQMSALQTWIKIISAFVIACIVALVNLFIRGE